MDILAVMDYNAAMIFCYKIDKDTPAEEIEAFIEQRGHRLSDCHYMVSPEAVFDVFYHN